MTYCTQAECLYLPIWEKLPFALGGKGLKMKQKLSKPYRFAITTILQGWNYYQAASQKDSSFHAT